MSGGHLLCADRSGTKTHCGGDEDGAGAPRRRRRILRSRILFYSKFWKRRRRMSEQIKRLKRELKFKGTILEFYQDTMEINGDHTAVWDFIKHKGAAAVVPVTEDGKILMVRQYRNALERYTLEIPAGALDEENEPGRECASRELEEETGFRSENMEWLITLRTTVAFCNERIEVYVAKDLIPSKQHLDEDEFIDLRAYTLEELKEKIFSGEIEDGKTVASLMAYAVKYGK